MKKSEIEDGKLYATKGWSGPAVLLLSTQQVKAVRRDGGTVYIPSSDRAERYRRIGYLYLHGRDVDALRGIDAAAALQKIMAGEPRADFLPDGVCVDLLFSLSGVIGPYDEVKAQRDESDRVRRENEERWTREYNEAVDGLNSYLETKLSRVPYRLSQPRRVELTTAQTIELREGIGRFVAEQLRISNEIRDQAFLDQIDSGELVIVPREYEDDEE